MNPLNHSLKSALASVEPSSTGYLLLAFITLHSHRCAWAERARRAGYPLRFAEEALGHNSKAVHQAYARHAEIRVPCLEDWEHAPAQSLLG